MMVVKFIVYEKNFKIYIVKINIYHRKLKKIINQIKPVERYVNHLGVSDAFRNELQMKNAQEGRKIPMSSYIFVLLLRIY